MYRHGKDYFSVRLMRMLMLSRRRGLGKQPFINCDTVRIMLFFRWIGYRVEGLTAYGMADSLDKTVSFWTAVL